MLRWMLVLSDVAQNGRCLAEDGGLYNFSHGGGIQIKSQGDARAETAPWQREGGGLWTVEGLGQKTFQQV